jgi:PIN domain nuclease of toxin-antitoxin system
VESPGFEKLRSVTPKQVATLAQHHSDPFGRMLVAQASCERLTLVTHDRRFAPYGIDVLWT